MELEIKDQAIEAITNHLRAVRSRDRQVLMRLTNRMYDENDNNVIIPALNTLLEYGAEVQKITPSLWPRFNLNFMSGRANSELAYSYEQSFEQVELFEGLINKYQQDKKAFDKHKLFSKKIGEMSGYEYEQYELLRKKS